MKRYKTKLTDVPDYFLLALLQSPNARTNLKEVRQELDKRLKNKSKQQLLLEWKHLRNPLIREMLEQELAVRYQDYDSSSQWLSKVDYQYFEQVQSLDAIVTLTKAKDPAINQPAIMKYMEAMDIYLEETEQGDFLYYENEGSDLILENNGNIIKFKQQEKNTTNQTTGQLAKVYKMNDIRQGRKK